MDNFFYHLHTTFMDTLTSAERAENFKNLNCQNEDVIIKQIVVGGKNMALVFVDEIANQQEINKSIVEPLSLYKGKKFSLEELQNSVVFLCNGEILPESDALEKLLRGFAILFVDGEEETLCFNTVFYEGRSVEEPPTSTVISGPREGFTEVLRTNVALIRKRCPSKNLKIEEIVLGKRTKTRINLIYFCDIAKDEVVREIKDKLNSVEIDGVIDSYYVTKLLEDRPNSIFNQVGNCEKPDVACAKLLEGRVVILVDGTPVALTVPYLFFEDFQSSNDYYSDAHRATALRIIRVMGIFISIFLPGMYIALQLYHYKVLPIKFLVTIVNTSQNLPLNPFLEIFFIIILFDILFEASVRMPKYLGMAISIVGALILGDTAVKAGLVSPPGVMIVALSAITVYIIPNQSSQISLLRIVFAIIGGTLGFHGIVLGLIFIVSYLCNMDSFKTPFFAPYAPYIPQDQKDFVLKDSLVAMKTRPKSIPHKKDVRLVIKDKSEGKK